MELDSLKPPIRLFAYAMIAAPVLLLVSDIATNQFDDDNARTMLTNVADNQALHYVGNLVGALGAVCLVVAVVGVGLFVATKRRRLGTIAGSIAAFGAVWVPGTWLLSIGVEHLAATDRNHAALAAFMDRADDSAALGLSWVVPFALLLGGLIALSIGLFNSRAVPRWIPIVMIVGILATFFAGDGVGSYVASLLMIAGLGGLGVTLLRGSTETAATPLPPDTTAPATA
jgi:hypothetical protein